MITHRMGVTFTKLGLHPGMAATHFLPAVVGPQVTIKLKSDLRGEKDMIQVFFKFNHCANPCKDRFKHIFSKLYSIKVFFSIAPSTSNSSTPSI